MESKLIVLVGLPCSGKSTLAEEFRKKGYEIYEEEKGIVFEKSPVFEKIKRAFKEKNRVVYDARNITYKERKFLLNQIKEIDCKKTCIVVATPFEICQERNKKWKHVSDEELKKCYMNWMVPYYYEGWDKINISIEEYRGIYGLPEDFPKKVMDFDCDQRYILGEHCQLTAECIKTTSSPMIAAAYLHDSGKYINANLSERKYQFHHNNTGAYDSMFYELKNPLKCSILISLHMIPYLWDWEKDPEKKDMLKRHYYKIWGKQLYRSVMKLHKADMEAHK